MAAKSAPVLPPPTTAAVAVMMSVCVVVTVAASLLAGAAPPPVSGDPVAGLPALMAARGSSGGGRVGDSEPVEMDSEAHRRVVLALRGGGSSPAAQRAYDPNKAWCDRNCPAKPGEPYVPDPRGCLKIYRCPGATSANMNSRTN